MRFAHVQRRRQVARQVRQRHVVGHVEDQHEADALQQRLPLFDEQRREALFRPRAFVRFARFGFLLEGRRFLELEPYVEADEAERPGDEERHAPAPRQQRFLRQRGRQQRDRSRAERIADQRAELEEAAHEAATPVGRELGDEGGGAAVLAAGREALHEAGDEQQDRGHDADRRIARDQADREGADGHHDHRGGEHALAADAIAERAEHHAAERTHEERGRERAEGGQQLRGRAAGREEHLAERDGDIAVDAEVEPFHRVAERHRADRALEDGRVDDRDVIQLDGLARRPGFRGARLRRAQCSLLELPWRRRRRECGRGHAGRRTAKADVSGMPRCRWRDARGGRHRAGVLCEPV
ncbi:hypothetical protein P355_1905 [Burkholderia cenocepacia KC-01]|nr:hypothetical protein P355_1905 [Burkholderia cenocepacia KC-01]